MTEELSSNTAAAAVGGSSSSSAEGVRVVETHWVAPGDHGEGEGETILPLTYFDFLWLTSKPVEWILFYDLPPTEEEGDGVFLSTVVPRLISSLSLALRHFFPLAGRVRPSSSDSDVEHEIHYARGDAVPLTIARYEGADFQALARDDPREVAQLQGLVPALHAKDRLLALQATVFPGGKGFSIGVTVHHVAGDGSSTTHFLKSWAAACRTGGLLCPVPPPPIFDRSLIVDTTGIYAAWKRDIAEFVVLVEENKKGEEEEAALQSTFILTREHIEQLKRRAVGSFPPGDSTIRCSTFAVTCAFAWTCVVRSSTSDHQQEEEDGNEDEVVHFGCGADARARMDPPVPQAYFGNCLLMVHAVVRAKDLLVPDEAGSVAASVAIARGVKRLNREGPREAEQLIRRIMSMAGRRRQPLSVAGSPRFGVYGIDFGWGGPRKMDMTSIVDTGAISLAESRDHHGGVEIGVAMPHHQLQRFATHFLTLLPII